MCSCDESPKLSLSSINLPKAHADCHHNQAHIQAINSVYLGQIACQFTHRNSKTEPEPSLSHNNDNHRVQTSAIVQAGCRDWSLFDKS